MCLRSASTRSGWHRSWRSRTHPFRRQRRIFGGRGSSLCSTVTCRSTGALDVSDNGRRPGSRRRRGCEVAVTSGPDSADDPAVDQGGRPSLTPRELEILRLWVLGESKKATATDLGISLGTINTHLIRIRAKYAQLGRPVADKTELLIRALQDGIVTLGEL
ncbi:LuxR family transcriptional regulator [Rhodococcus sp. WS4]|nr:LuxR family transcriptional regulator [Rhodococcus sp. WS4]